MKKHKHCVLGFSRETEYQEICSYRYRYIGIGNGKGYRYR